MKIGIYGIKFNPEKLSTFQNLFTYLKSKTKNNTISIFTGLYKQLVGNVNNIDRFDRFSYSDEIQDFDLLICLGGDGSILDSLSIVRGSNVPVFGINTGRLGFLSSISSENVRKPLDKILAGNIKHDKRSVLKLSTKSNHFGDINYALNEVTVHKKDSSSMMIIHTYVENEYLNSYWADGLIVSSPTGSTGYNLSCSGPIIMPGSEVFIITPIAPHNLNVRPLIIPDNKKIKLKLEGRDDEFLVALDARSEPIKIDEELVIEKGEFYMNVVRTPQHSFFSTIRNKLNWGLDNRN
ncbi:MAG: NAD kinase [Flavobacteriales bacterium]|nr:NAD kinase [Flavobacteriales bacterium]|tara:strand:- start:11206 stop:12087 length:882 start_codon:yes stop_codon:yes gene_type:complete